MRMEDEEAGGGAYADDNGDGMSEEETGEFTLQVQNRRFQR